MVMETHTFEAFGSTFVVDQRYSLVRRVGHGAFFSGAVVSATDSETGETVAIEKMTINNLVPTTHNLGSGKRLLREIRLLRCFGHENVLAIRDMMMSESINPFPAIVSELMETDLHRVIYSRQVLTPAHLQYFLYQIMRALKYIHSAGVLHRDLKPSKLLLNANCDLKVSDFHCSRGVSESTHDDLTVDRKGRHWRISCANWYRAPEMMLTTAVDTTAVDIWSAGCIFAEMLGRKPLFPGEDYIHQIQIIFEQLGTPAETDTRFITSEKARRFVHNQAIQRKKPFTQRFAEASPEAVDLLDKMLTFDPNKRIGAENALAHPYFGELRHTDDEPVVDAVFAWTPSFRACVHALLLVDLRLSRVGLNGRSVKIMRGGELVPTPLSLAPGLVWRIVEFLPRGGFLFDDNEIDDEDLDMRTLQCQLHEEVCAFRAVENKTLQRQVFTNAPAVRAAGVVENTPLRANNKVGSRRKPLARTFRRAECCLLM